MLVLCLLCKTEVKASILQWSLQSQAGHLQMEVEVSGDLNSALLQSPIFLFPRPRYLPASTIHIV